MSNATSSSQASLEMAASHSDDDRQNPNPVNNFSTAPIQNVLPCSTAAIIEDQQQAGPNAINGAYADIQ